MSSNDRQGEAGLVSVVIATRNRVELLQAAVRAILRQDYQNLQVIVIDDGSSAEVVAANKPFFDSLDSRVEWHRPATPGAPGTGPGAARNRGIAAARGEYVAFCDDDDEWIADDHVRVAVDAMQKFDADFYFSNLAMVREGKVLHANWYAFAPKLSLAPELQAEPRIQDATRSELEDVLRKSMIHPDACVIRRSLLNKTGRFLENINYSEDVNLCFRLIDNATRTLYRPATTANYRFPIADSVTLTQAGIENMRQRLYALTRAYYTCRTPWVKRSAAITRSWLMGELAVIERKQGNWVSSARYGWTGFYADPKMGSFIRFCKHAIPILPRTKKTPASA